MTVNSIGRCDSSRSSRLECLPYWMGKHVKVNVLFESRGSRRANHDYLYCRKVGLDSYVYGFPSDVSYEVELDLGYHIGTLRSPIEYGEFLYYGCTSCGYRFFDAESRSRTQYIFGSPCPQCGKHTVHSICDGSPHMHRRYYVFQLHILDLSVRDTLSAFLGVDPDSCLGFSCKGSWHNFRNDNSGYDVCHKNCLDNLIHLRIQRNLSGVDLFKTLYPELGVVFTGKNYPLTGWKDGEQVSKPDFESVKAEYGMRKDSGQNCTFYQVLSEVIP